MVLVYYLLVGRVQLRSGDHVVAHEFVERVELVVVYHRHELPPVHDFVGLLVEVLVLEELLQALRLRRRDPEARRVGPELVHEVQERPVFVHLALVERLAPVDDLLLRELAFFALLLPVLVLLDERDLALDDPGLAPEPVADDRVPLWRYRPLPRRRRALPEALRDDVAVACVRDVAHVRGRVHPPVRDEDEPAEPEAVHRPLHRGPERVVVERVAGEHLERHGDAVVVHEEPDLDDGLLPVLLAHAELPETFLDDVPRLVQDVFVRLRDLEVEVGHVVEHQRRVPPDPALDARVHPPEDPFRVPVDDRERIVHVVGVVAGDQGLVVLPVLLHRRALRRGLEDPAVDEKPHEPLEVVPDLRGMLDAREELVEAERGEHRVEDARRETPGFAVACRVALAVSEVKRLRRAAADIRKEFRNHWLPVAEGLAQAVEVVGRTVVVPRQGPDVQHDLLDDRPLSLGVCSTVAPCKLQVLRSVVVRDLYVHGATFYAIYTITYKLYHRLRKFARGNIDFIEDFSLGHAENLPPKWQSRDASGRCQCPD